MIYDKKLTIVLPARCPVHMHPSRLHWFWGFPIAIQSFVVGAESVGIYLCSLFQIEASNYQNLFVD